MSETAKLMMISSGRLKSSIASSISRNPTGIAFADADVTTLPPVRSPNAASGAPPIVMNVTSNALIGVAIYAFYGFRRDRSVVAAPVMEIEQGA